MCVVDDDHTYRFLDAPGEWAGGTTRDDAVPLGRMTSDRGHARDEWRSGDPRHRFGAWWGWCLAGTTPPTAGWPAPSGSPAPKTCCHCSTASLMCPWSKSRWRAGRPGGHCYRRTGAPDRAGYRCVRRHAGVRPGLLEAVHEVRRARARAGQPARAQTQPGERGRRTVAGPGRATAGRVVSASAGRRRTGAPAARQPNGRISRCG